MEARQASSVVRQRAGAAFLPQADGRGPRADDVHRPTVQRRIDGHVCGLGSVHHQNFAMASGEMTTAEFTEFLHSFMRHAVDSARWGDPVHLHGLAPHGRSFWSPPASSTELKNLCVWNKTNGGMGPSTAPSTRWCLCSRWARPAHQQFRAGREGPLSYQRLGLCRGKQLQARPHRRLAPTRR